MDFWWEHGDGEAEQVRDIFENSTYGITNSELVAAGLSWDDLREAYDSGFISDQSQDARERFFDYLADLGYDLSDFDWDDWRDWYENAS